MTECTSGIKSIGMDSAAVANKIFTLDGRQVNGENLTPGIYISKGKKFLVK